ncbi:MAG TPA: flagellar biosynthetic protein FliR [Bryobacteraceae bacterium]|jgi:flagellar biosynthetic protein FliR|nr:flagellar biosynthetic protein FliR [Bryobacteraceae bacterium]
MGGNLLVSTATLLGFLLTLARVAGVFVFVPMPGIGGVINPARVILTMGITIALFPLWPHIAVYPSAGTLVMWLLVEAALGIGIGLSVAFITEAFSMGAQTMSLQAGYAFASTFDPNTQADSGVVVVLLQIVCGLLFFTTGLDREVIRIFARSLEIYPAGSFLLTRDAATQLLSMGSTIFSTGLRLALPIIAVMVMIDISLALLGRVNSQLQLTIVAFPVKMLIFLTLLGWLAVLFPVLFRAQSGAMLTAARGLLAR